MQNTVKIIDKSPIRKPLVIGATIIDRNCKLKEPTVFATTIPGSIKTIIGGVGRNLATTMSKLGIYPRFLTCIPKDLKLHDGIDSSLFKIDDSGSSVVSILDEKGELIIGCAEITLSITRKDIENAIKDASIVVFDANISTECILEILKQNEIPTIFEPTSVSKSVSIIGCGKANIVTPNLSEFNFMADHLPESIIDFEFEEITEFADIFKKASKFSEICDYLVLKMGKDGVLLFSFCEKQVKFFNAPISEIVNVSGSGDTLVGALATILSKSSRVDWKIVERGVEFGIEAAAKTLSSHENVGNLEGFLRNF